MLFLVNDLISLTLKEKIIQNNILKQIYEPDLVLGTLNAYNKLINIY